MSDKEIRFLPRWTTKEAAKSAKISEPTVRKYAQILEHACGHPIHTINEKGDRRFSDHDIVLFIEIKKLTDETGMNVPQAANIVIGKFGFQKEKNNTLDTELIKDTQLIPVIQDLQLVVERAGRQFWENARKELMEDVRRVIREEMKSELQPELDYLKHELEEVTEVTRQVAASLEMRKKPWWKRNR